MLQDMCDNDEMRHDGETRCGGADGAVQGCGGCTGGADETRGVCVVSRTARKVCRETDCVYWRQDPARICGGCRMQSVVPCADQAAEDEMQLRIEF